MFLHHTNGMAKGEIYDLFPVNHSVFLGITRQDEGIILGSHYNEADDTEKVYFIVETLDTEEVVQLWEFPENYDGLHPMMYFHSVL